MARSAEDYGIPGLSDEVLRVLAGNTRRYGEKGRFAVQELGQRQGLTGEADQYRQALQRATYQQLSPEFEQGLARITSGLAGAGPLADSGQASALRARLASGIYGQAAGRIGGSYADYLGSILKQRRGYNYQRQLMAYNKKLNKKGIGSTIAGGLAGGLGGFLGGGPAGAVAGAAGSIRGLPQGDFPLGSVVA